MLQITNMSAIETIFHESSDLLRFITCGSVDDGKSTLIGRLLFDSKSIFEDQLEAVGRASQKRGSAVDLSLLTDGLQAEREQGITIDVAYRYFATPKRKFIIADTPGHEQYTRNMVTGASTANLAIVLIDARKGVLTQSRRHAYIASLLRIPHLVVAINKMDLVGYSQSVFDAIRADFENFTKDLGFAEIIYIPMSALNGDMVVERGDNLGWYQGKALLETLERIEISHDINTRDFRFPVQWVCRPSNADAPELHDFRGYAGRIEAGEVRVGDRVTVLPSGKSSRVREIVAYTERPEVAVAPQSVTLLLEDQIDISRGDMIVGAGAAPRITREFDAMLCWLSETPLDAARKYLVKHTTKTVKSVIGNIYHRVDVNTLRQENGITALHMNDIAKVSVKVQQGLAVDRYKGNRATGNFIVIDAATNNTVAAGMIL